MTVDYGFRSGCFDTRSCNGCEDSLDARHSSASCDSGNLRPNTSPPASSERCRRKSSSGAWVGQRTGATGACARDGGYWRRASLADSWTERKPGISAFTTGTRTRLGSSAHLKGAQGQGARRARDMVGAPSARTRWAVLSRMGGISWAWPGQLPPLLLPLPFRGKSSRWVLQAPARSDPRNW
jgi:hypothetical protein